MKKTADSPFQSSKIITVVLFFFFSQISLCCSKYCCRYSKWRTAYIIKVTFFKKGAFFFPTFPTKTYLFKNQIIK